MSYIKSPTCTVGQQFVIGDSQAAVGDGEVPVLALVVQACARKLAFAAVLLNVSSTRPLVTAPSHTPYV